MDRPALFERLAAVTAVVTFPVGILAGIFLGTIEAAVVFVVWWLLLAPIFGMLSDDGVSIADEKADSRDTTESEDAPLEVLKTRYARGPR